MGSISRTSESQFTTRSSFSDCSEGLLLHLVQDTKDNREIYISEGVPLYKLALSGKWKDLKPKLEGINGDHLLRTAVTKGGATILHVATAANQVHLVEELVKLTKKENLELKDFNGNTAFFLAAGVGNCRLATAMWEKNKDLPIIRGNQELTPLHFAMIQGRSEMASLLYEKITRRDDHWSQDLDWGVLFLIGVNAEMYDLALKILEGESSLATARDRENNTGLHLLARKKLSKYVMKHTQVLQLIRHLWKIILTTTDSEADIYKIIDFPSPLIFDAALIGNFEFLAELMSIYPDLMWIKDNKGRSIIHFAVEYRHVRLFNLIHEISSIKDVIVSSADVDNNTLLHLAAKLAPPDQLNLVSGAAFQLMLELIWFEKVKKIMGPFNIEAANNSEGLTPSEIFTKEHENLLEKAEKWMKGTAKSCMVVSTVITAGVFSTAFNLPGGINDNTGIPNYFKEPAFTVFSVSNAIALISSAASILIFLSILISRYAQSEFYKKLPLKLICGLVTLFISIINMMTAFSSALFITYYHGMNLVPFLISVLAFLLIPLFLFLQFSLWFDIIHSTYYCKTLFRPNKAYALLGK